MSNKLYQEELMDHFKYPRNRKKLKNPDFKSGQFNPSCGDKIYIEGQIEIDSKTGNQIILNLGFEGSGCVISQAAASMLTEKCKGQNIDKVLKITKDDIIKMIGLQLGPVRLKCALLCLQALHQGLLEFKKEKK